MNRPIFGSTPVTPTMLRDQVAAVAKSDAAKAAVIAETINDPWFAAQAWSHVARYTDDVIKFSTRAAKAASEAKDDYQRSAVRAWEIAALAEREYYTEAREALAESVQLAKLIEHAGSKAEAFLLLFQAAFKISIDDATMVADALERLSIGDHWRAIRGRKVIAAMLDKVRPPREFYW